MSGWNYIYIKNCSIQIQKLKKQQCSAAGWRSLEGVVKLVGELVMFSLVRFSHHFSYSAYAAPGKKDRMSELQANTKWEEFASDWRKLKKDQSLKATSFAEDTWHPMFWELQCQLWWENTNNANIVPVKSLDTSSHWIEWDDALVGTYGLIEMHCKT